MSQIPLKLIIQGRKNNVFSIIRAIHMLLCHLTDVTVQCFIKFYTKTVVVLDQHPFL